MSLALLRSRPAEVKDVIPTGTRCVVTVRISIPCLEGIISREATGSEDVGRAGYGDPSSNADAMALKKHLLRLAVEWEFTPLNPAQGVKPPRVPAGRVRYLQPTELRLLLETAQERLRPIIILAVVTGMRRSEVLGLRWLDVDLPRARTLLPQTKRRRPHHLPEYCSAGRASIAASLRANGSHLHLVPEVPSASQPLGRLFSGQCLYLSVLSRCSLVSRATKPQGL